MAVTGSPGSTASNEKMTMLTSSSVGSTSRMRLSSFGMKKQTAYFVSVAVRITPSGTYLKPLISFERPNSTLS